MKIFSTIVLILIIGCAPIMRPKPTVYTMPARGNYVQDLAACEVFADRATSEDPSALDGAVAGGLGGALAGAAFGALIGAAFGIPGTGASYGAGYGAGSGILGGAAVNTAEQSRRWKEASVKCLKNKGYNDASY